MAGHSFAQNMVFDWAVQMGGPGDDQGYAIMLDAANNVYTTGYFNDTADFDPGPGTYNLISAGEYDVFVSKLDENGNFVWAQSMGGTGSDISLAATLDVGGNVVCTGSFSGTADFDPGPGTYNLTATGPSAIYVTKLDASGNLVWAKMMSGNHFSDGRAVTTDSGGNVFITGTFLGTVDFDPGPGTYNLTSTSASSIFISKLNPAGDFLWAIMIDGSLSNNIGRGITTDNFGNVYVTGEFTGTADFDPGPGTLSYTANTSMDVFLCKYDPSGNLIFAHRFDGNDVERGMEVTVGPTGNIYLTGEFYGTTDFNPGPALAVLTPMSHNDCFIVKLDPFGNFVWVKVFQGAFAETSMDLQLDDDENIYTVGLFSQTIDMDPGPLTYNFSTMGGVDAFLSKLDSSGNFVWGKQIEGPSGSNSYGEDIVLSNSGDVYVTGLFRNLTDFDPDAGTHFLTTSGDNDVFVLKLIPDPLNVNDEEFATTVSVYPNPTTGPIQIQLGKNIGEVTVTVRNTLGQLITTEQFSSNGISLEIHGNPGLYFVELQDTQGNTAQAKVIKH